MQANRKHRILSYIAMAVACVMLGSGLTLLTNQSATAEDTATQTVVVTSPFTSAISQVRSSVVGVNNYKTVRYSNYSNGFGNYFFGNGNRGNNNETEAQTTEVLSATGSGVVVAEHLVVTNYHVVEEASRVDLSIYNYDTDEITQVDAAVVVYDETNDIAILYAPDLDLTPVTLGDSDNLQVGDWAIVIGNPLGESFFGTVTTGIISALNRSVSSTTYDKYGRRETSSVEMIQTDASINSGNSGGGLFTVTGELVGIPAVKYSSSGYSTTSIDGIGMAIPINLVKPLLEEVLSGNITLPDVNSSGDESETNNGTSSSSNDLTGRPRLGITITALNTNSTALLTGALPNGVYVVSVEENSPAAVAGMQAGDIIVDIDDTVISSVSQLQSIVGEHAEGDTLNVKVYRVEGITDMTSYDDIPEGEYVDLQVTLAVVDVVAQ